MSEKLHDNNTPSEQELEQVKSLMEKYHRVIKDIEARTALKEMFLQLQSKQTLIVWETMEKGKGYEGVLRETLDACDLLDRNLKKNIVWHCQGDANRFLDEIEDLAKRTDDIVLHCLIGPLKIRADRVSNLVNQESEDWNDVSQLVHDYWYRSLQTNLKVKALYFPAWMKDIHEEPELEKVFNDLKSKGEEIEEAAGKDPVDRENLSNLRCEYETLDKLLIQRLRGLCGLMTLRGLRRVPFRKDKSLLGQVKMNAEYQLEKVLPRIDAFLKEYDVVISPTQPSSSLILDYPEPDPARDTP
ncbi:MAG: hypothetical protein Q9213_000222 [Squamulea squamosa]